MDRFLVQVNRDVGFANITINRRYENVLWRNKPRDSAHGEVKPGDELVIYCTSKVPGFGKTIGFTVRVSHVSSDNVSFELEELSPVPIPLPLTDIRELVNRGMLPPVFERCGQQGFNIAKLDDDAVSRLYPLIFEGDSVEHHAESEPPRFAISDSEDGREYTIESIIEDGCFIDEDRLSSILESLKIKKTSYCRVHLELARLG